MADNRTALGDNGEMNLQRRGWDGLRQRVIGK